MSDVKSRAALAALFVACMIGLGLGLYAYFHGPAASGMRRETITLTTSAGPKAISAEIALSGPEQEQGLMFRKQLGDDEGMLFVYQRPQDITMWMRNTYIPLDMVFISSDSRIAHIVEGAEPLSERIISSGGKAQSVLELKAGTVRRLGLATGDRVAASSLASVP